MTYLNKQDRFLIAICSLTSIINYHELLKKGQANRSYTADEWLETFESVRTLKPSANWRYPILFILKIHLQDKYSSFGS